jgi:hypothetical protein
VPSKKQRTRNHLETYKAANMKRPCRVPGCNRTRLELAAFCRPHQRVHTKHGHPLGRHIYPRDYATEKKIVSDFLAKHESHAGVQAALRFLHQWLHSASIQEAVPAQYEFARLHAAGVKPLTALIEMCSVYLYSRWHPKQLPDDQRLTFALGRAVIGLVHKEKRFAMHKGKPVYEPVAFKKVAKREAGERIRNLLLPLLVGVAVGIEEEHDRKQQDLAALHQPFHTAAET